MSQALVGSQGKMSHSCVHGGGGAFFPDVLGWMYLSGGGLHVGRSYAGGLGGPDAWSRALGYCRMGGFPWGKYAFGTLCLRGVQLERLFL